MSFEGIGHGDLFYGLLIYDVISQNVCGWSVFGGCDVLQVSLAGSGKTITLRADSFSLSLSAVGSSPLFVLWGSSQIHPVGDRLLEGADVYGFPFMSQYGMKSDED